MKKIIKKLIPKSLLDKYYPYKWQYLNIKTLIKEYNQLQSMKEWKSIDKNNNPIAWYTYPTLEYLNALDLREKLVLEWGGVARLYTGVQGQKK